MNLVGRLGFPPPVLCARFGKRGEDPPHLPGWRLDGIQGGRLMSIGSTGGSRLDIDRTTRCSVAGPTIIPSSHAPCGSSFCKFLVTPLPHNLFVGIAL